jgi:hypothetical protein
MDKSDLEVYNKIRATLEKCGWNVDSKTATHQYIRYKFGKKSFIIESNQDSDKWVKLTTHKYSEYKKLMKW